MKTKIFGVLTIISAIVADMFFGLFAGTILAYVGFFMLLIACLFLIAAIEAHPRKTEIQNKIAKLMTED